ncbi:MAG TPA: ATP-binding protein [Methylibium sp.]|nr:ATP-binding protein [Methylibium sp.]
MHDDEEGERLALLQQLGVLDTDPEPAFDALVASASRVLGCPVALVSLVDAERLWFKAQVGVKARHTERRHSFCDLAIRAPGLLEIEDLSADPRTREHPMVAGQPQMRFYAGQPLEVLRQRVGTLCVSGWQPHRLDARDRELLAQLAQAAAGLLLSRHRLHAAERDHQRLLDFGRAGGDWMWESDTEHRYVWLSESFEARTGMSSAEMVGRRISDFAILDRDGEPLRPPQRFRAVLDRHGAFARVLGAKASPRGEVLLSRSAVPFFDADGRFAGYRGTIRDVTAQVRAVGRERERDERLAKLASQVPGIVFQYQWHPDGRSSYPYMSERAREVLGSDAPPGGTGSDPSLPDRLLHPDDREVFEQGIAQSARALTRLVLEYRIVREDGRVRWLETFATPERLADGGVLWHGFSADITPRKEAEAAHRRMEAQWQLAAGAARIGLAQAKLADRIVQLDAQALANHGFAAQPHGFTLEAWLAQIVPADRETAAAGVRTVLAEDGVHEGRYRIHRPDGTLRWLEFVVRASHDAEGRVDGLVGTCRDVHEQQTAEQLERARLDAERASRAKSEFLSRLSHELRTPLNGILGFAQLMAIDREQPLAGRQAQRLASMRHAGTHLLGLINDVLEISRHDGNEPQGREQPVALDAALDSALGLVQPLAEQHRVTVERAAGTAPGTVLGEPRRLEQVLMNLLTNAIKFSEPLARVLVRVEHAGAETRVAVIDHGQGLDAPQQAKLFQPFERLGAEKRQIDGVGLGLFISRQLVEAMGGRIEVASRPGRGSTFTVVLRRAEAAAPPAPAAPAAPAPAATADGATTAPRRIVYVEDEALNQLLFQELIRSRPEWELQIAGDGATALRIAHERPPDLMLIDINLPDMSGLALIDRLRSDAGTRALRCIALSADAMAEQVAAAHRAGFDDYWTKPIDVAQVLAKLDALLAPGARGAAP